MTVYIVVQSSILGAMTILGVYQEEIAALREANKSILRTVIPMELI
jgi:hypothetical protein